MIRVSPDVSKAIPLDNISYDLAPPRFAKTELLGGHENITTGFLLSRDNLGLMDTLPDPDDIELYRPAEKFLERYKGSLAAICSVRSGPSNTYLSMGIEHFCQSIISDPELVREAFCDEIGADGYAIDAAEGVALSRKLIEPKSSRL